MIVFPESFTPISESGVEVENLESYLAKGGYVALKDSLDLPPSSIIDTVSTAGLRGRGGAGFPAGRKWQIAVDTDILPRYLVCNAGEDEPGSFKDRLIIERRPHLLIEGLILASYAIGAEVAHLYINETYVTCHSRIKHALGEARAASYIGKSICGTDYSLEIKLHEAPTVYVAGEDSAVLEFIEGREAKPREKPPYPAVSGLYGKPTVVNNVETLAHVARIIREGSEWYRGFGVEDNAGTMIFCLGEEVKNPGAYELPLGTTARYLLEECGGGLCVDRKVKAFLPGGPSCAFLPGDKLDVPLDNTSLRDAGSSLGCGVMRFYSEDTCMLEPTLELAGFFSKESCGQCPACRMETSMLVALLEKIQKGEGNRSLYDQFSKIIEFNKGKGFCALINMPGPPIVSALNLFADDFEYHSEHGGCPGS